MLVVHLGKLVWRGRSKVPDEVQIDFGHSLSAQGETVLAAGASAGANYKVTSKWNKTSED
jgi:hypothetical protein